MNEESVGNVMAYFNELKQQKANKEQYGSYSQSNMGYTQTQGHVINVAGDRSAKSGLSFNQNILNEQMMIHQQKQAMMGQTDPASVGSSQR